MDTPTHPNTAPSSSIIEMPGLTQPEAWETPLRFNTMPPCNLSTDCLPGVLGEFAAALAQSTETPIALSLMTLLGILSTVFTQRITVSPKAGWHESVNLYLLVALPPANHKSLVLKHGLQPLIDWEKSENLLQREEIARQIAERKTQEKIIDGLRARVAKCKNNTEQQQLITQITEKEINLLTPAALPVLFVNDVTPESLTQLVHEQAGRLAIFSDEGGILENLAGLYTRGVANTDILLKGIDGGHVRVCRKDRRLSLNPYLTIFLTVQPKIIQNMAKKNAYQDNGTLERFLYMLPSSQLGYRTHNTSPIPDALKKAYHDHITTWLNFYKNKKLDSPQILTLSTAAYACWHQFQQHIEKTLRPSGQLAGCPGWGGKLCGFTLRIAGLLHQAALNPHDTTSTRINETTMNHAIALAKTLTTHATIAFELMGTDASIDDARGVYDWIMDKQQPSFKQTEITRALRNRAYGRSTRLAKTLACLQERHIISQPIKLPTRKPSTLYYVNPQLLDSTD